MKIFKRVKKNILFATTLMLITATAFISQSCNSNGDEFVNNPTSSFMNPNVTTNSANSRALMIDSISESDELLDFRMSCKFLAEKVQTYTATLSKKELNKFIENINNDDYMETFTNKSNIRNELLAVASAQNALLNKSNFSQLTDVEKTNLFIGFSKSSLNVTIKSRSEGATKSECRRRYDEDYKYNTAAYLLAMAGCVCTGPVAGCFCAAGASIAHSHAMTLANRNDEDCMRSATNL